MNAPATPQFHDIKVSEESDLGDEDKQPQVVEVSCYLVARLDDGQEVIVSERMSADMLNSCRSKMGLLFASLTKRAIRACNIAGAQAKGLLSH